MSEPTPENTAITFVDAFIPRLSAGKYTLTAKQEIRVKNEKGEYVSITDKKEDSIEYKEEKEFYVTAPRFKIAPDEIYSVYPPSNQNGPYSQTVPHVVFRRKALPWERLPWAKEDKKLQEPWVALLVFTHAELSGLSETDLENLGEDKIPPPPLINCPYEQLIKPPNIKTYGPKINLDPWEEANPIDDNKSSNQCTVIDIPWLKFKALRPSRSDMKYLVHARHVVPGLHKEDIPGIGDGWFSVVLANRLPVEKKRNIALLVSLEGYEELIEKEPTVNTIEKVRLVVLTSWSFFPEGPGFKEQLEGLSRDQNGKPKDTWLRASLTYPLTSVDGCVAEALRLGYVPLKHNLRQGDRTVSWYRGPLVPVSIPAETTNRIYINADEALQFDPDSGLFDISYAAAWQLGRLLALQSSNFAQLLYQWIDGENYTKGVIDEAKNNFDELFPQHKLDQNQSVKLLQDDLIIAVALEYINQSQAKL